MSLATASVMNEYDAAHSPPLPQSLMNAQVASDVQSEDERCLQISSWSACRLRIFHCISTYVELNVGLFARHSIWLGSLAMSRKPHWHSECVHSAWEPEVTLQKT